MDQHTTILVRQGGYEKTYTLAEDGDICVIERSNGSMMNHYDVDVKGALKEIEATLKQEVTT
jgi:hypothetical protein